MSGIEMRQYFQNGHKKGQNGQKIGQHRQKIGLDGQVGSKKGKIVKTRKKYDLKQRKRTKQRKWTNKNKIDEYFLINLCTQFLIV